MKKQVLLDKIKGALYGVAVGDALGAPAEFLCAEHIREKFGTLTEMVGGGWFDLKPGEITDDTNMTIAVILGILEAPTHPEENIGKHFIDWYSGKGFWTEKPKDIGNTCKKVIQEVILSSTNHKKPSYTDWERASRETWECTLKDRPEGNGALMRTIYPALYYTDMDLTKVYVENIARMTHWAPISTDCCISYVTNVHDLLFGYDGKLEPLWNDLSKAMDDPKHITPTGHCINSYVIALNTVNNSSSFENAIIPIVNGGGDTDTIAAIAGGLAGAKYGFGAIPTRWVDALDDKIKKTLDYAAIKACEQHLKNKWQRRRR